MVSTPSGWSLTSRPTSVRVYEGRVLVQRVACTGPLLLVGGCCPSAGEIHDRRADVLDFEVAGSFAGYTTSQCNLDADVRVRTLCRRCRTENRQRAPRRSIARFRAHALTFRSDRIFDGCQQPIVLIGTGRSGSTLLTRMLDAHPAIDFKGETDFCCPALWLDVWHDRFWLNWPRQMSANARSAHAPFPEWDTDELEAERQRAALLVLDCLQGSCVSTCSPQVWGYKELWNGSPSFRFDWEHYDCVISRALLAASCARSLRLCKLVCALERTELDRPFSHGSPQGVGVDTGL